MAGRDGSLDTAAAVTRSMLGWGVVAGPFYVAVGLILALATPGFDLTRHALSLLMLSDAGWVQRANFVLSGLMVLVAAVGLLRAIRTGRGLAMSALTGLYGCCLILSAVFGPDPTSGFPPGAAGGTGSVHGILHLVFGGLGFLALAGAALAHGLWSRSIGAVARGRISFVLAVLIVVGFFAGAALSRIPAGTGLLWVAVLAGWAWLLLASVQVYVWSPHPLRAARAATGATAA